MRIKFFWGIFTLTAFAALTCTSLAEDAFHVHYRVANLNQDEHDLSGTVFLNVYNTSGGDIADMVAWIPTPNQVTYDQRQIGVGDLADGAQIEVLDPFIVPIEITQVESNPEPVSWRLEYTNALGERQSVDVVGIEVD
jgi:hypothetical protein